MVTLVEECERSFGRLCRILVLTSCLKKVYEGLETGYKVQIFMKKTSNVHLSCRHLPFYIDITFVLDTLSFHSLIYSTFCEQYIWWNYDHFSTNAFNIRKIL